MRIGALVCLLGLTACDSWYWAMGRVHDPRGRPIADAEVYLGGEKEMQALCRIPDAYHRWERYAEKLSRTGEPVDFARSPRIPSAVSDAGGNFDAMESTGGRPDVWMTVLKPGYQPYFALAPVTMRPGNRPPLEVVLEPVEKAAP